MHPAILQTLKIACFSNPSTSLSYKHVNNFTSSILDKPHEKEMPKPMLALALTAVGCWIVLALITQCFPQVYAALKDYSTGEDKALQFSATNYFEVYQRFAKLLDQVQAKQPIRFHNRMHQIYQFWCATTTILLSHSLTVTRPC